VADLAGQPGVWVACFHHIFGGDVRGDVPGFTYPDPERFVPFESRERRTDISMEMWDAIMGAKRQENGKAGVSWRGIPMRKDPWDVTMYPMIVWEVQPRTIIELGTYIGGSALWLADTATAFQLDTRIISVDIDLSQLQVKDPRIEYVQYDMFKIEYKPFPVALSDLPHPWLIIEDTHKNIVPVLEYFDPHVIRGDYLIVEDTCHLPTLDLLGEFMQEHGSRYRVDTKYVDNFGYNLTWNWNSMLACVEDPPSAQ
jgi:cephalosporin hydroxylase